MSAPAPAAGAAGGNAGAVVVPRVMSRAELVKLWEDLIDNDPDAAEELFFASLLRDARAEYGGCRARNGQVQGQEVVAAGKDADDEERRRRARVFRPWQLPAPGSALPPVAAAAAPPVQRAVVLGLRAPPHLVARRQERAPSAAAAGPGRPPEPVKEPPAV